jgi:hypothetical protein
VFGRFDAALGLRPRRIHVFCASCGELWCLDGFTLRLAQKGQPFWTSRRDVAVPGPSQYILLRLLLRSLSRADKVPDPILNKMASIALVRRFDMVQGCFWREYFKTILKKLGVSVPRVVKLCVLWLVWCIVCLVARVVNYG